MTRPKPKRAIALLLIALLGTAEADPFADARSEFMAAYQRVGAADPAPAAEDSAALQAYPLYPYLQASRLLLRLEDPAAAGSIEGFLASHGDAPVARSLRRSWLMSLAQRRRGSPTLRPTARTWTPRPPRAATPSPPGWRSGGSRDSPRRSPRST